MMDSTLLSIYQVLVSTWLFPGYPGEKSLYIILPAEVTPIKQGHMTFIILYIYLDYDGRGKAY